ncbi:hypothetical protein QYM36_014272 [Artemia franciscana]|uniref:Galactosylceramide sulfotransferase-like n=1 Tax=Artemia franciscana TaxID=6661 RepID=A0AA88L5F4_ARTSF|nr:hypothetical protein QYM36_014272 [Artemia franciscana]
MERKRNYIILLPIGAIGLFAVIQWNTQKKIKNDIAPVDNVGRNCIPVHSSLTQTCEPRRKLGFLKMHRCAGTTLQNIFLRYALTSNLNLVLPSEKRKYVGSPELFSQELVDNTPWHHLGYDMMAIHTRWDHKAIKEALGGDPAFVTIVRDPIEQFKSIYGYYNFFKFLGNLSFSQFLDNLKDFGLVRIKNVIGRNQMLFDLGFPVSDFDNEDKVKRFVEKARKIFDLVMVMEKFEESIVLLKHLLCWDYEDFVFLKLNSMKEGTKLKLSADQEDKLSLWLKADKFLYARLKEVFEKKIEEFGHKRMEEEKLKLSSIRNQVMERCLSGKQNITEDALIKEMRKHAGCRLYALGEYQFLDVVKSAQSKRADIAALKLLGLAD